MAFKFRLQKLLDYRKEQKKMAEEELARKQKYLQEIEEQLHEIKQQEEQLHQFHRQQVQKTDLVTLLSMENYQQLLDEQFYQNYQEFNRASQDVETKRNTVVKFWQSCEILHKLKEKSYQGYLEDEKSRERQANDEVALFNYYKSSESLLF